MAESVGVAGPTSTLLVSVPCLFRLSKTYTLSGARWPAQSNYPYLVNHG